MLFGVKLQNEIYPPWKNYYIDYEGLKKMLKENVLVGGYESWTDDDEKAFAAELDTELEKVYTFQVSKYKELDQEISKLELQTEKYLESLTAGKPSTIDSEAFQKKLEELLSEANELDHFARLNFTGFNKIVKKHDNLHKGYSVKALLNVRMKSLPLNNISEDTSPYLYRISVLYSFLRDQMPNDKRLSSSLSSSIHRLSTSGKLSTTPSAAVRGKEHLKVLKFWIHPDNLMEIKTTILRHLPVMIYSNQSGDDDDDEYVSDPTITSLYFDNRSVELYNAKLLKQKTKTPSLRIRWTGKLKSNSEVTIEKKTFDYDTGDEENVRLNLKQKYVNDFIFPGKRKNQIKGSSQDADDEDPLEEEEAPNDNLADLYEDLGYKSSKKTPLTLHKYVRRLQKRGLPASTIERYAKSFKEIQDFIIHHDLQPCMRSMYTRTAFQMPGDDRLRISIDSDLLFVREDAFDTDRPIRDPEQWHRSDIDSNVDNPFSLLRKGEYAKFPYSAMEIKIASSIINNPQSKTMKWVREMCNGHLVKEVPNFSKFIQGVSSLFLEDDNLEILPFWLPDLDTDIRKDPEQAYKDSKSKQLKHDQQAEVLKNLRKKIGETPAPAIRSGTTHLDHIIEEGEDLDVDDSSDEDSSNPSLPTTSSSSLHQDPTRKSVSAVADAQARETRSGSQVRAPPPAPIDPYSEEHRHPMRLAASKNFETRKDFRETFMPVFTKASKLEGYESEDEEVVLPTGVVKPKQLIRQSGPVKVEAKVWLANERTFVRWLHVTSLLTVLTFTIFSSVDSTHFPELAKATSYIYFALTLFSGVWAYAIYTKRLELIKLRSGKHLDGMLGPLVLASALLISLVLEYYAGIRNYTRSKALFAVDPTTSLFLLDQPGEQVQNLHPLLQWTLRKMVSIVN
ncbi:DEKNAAC103253 [Brettanomyces naardenensis]|uniref:DEKNAAC103253 n=1 Tax=Brettanomyces naardenensis TaxID=13370 RepID=A0A448YMY7_BRENA|nr:DEKNAAC103253 [Brettanomyces naardenensis]